MTSISGFSKVEEKEVHNPKNERQRESAPHLNMNLPTQEHSVKAMKTLELNGFPDFKSPVIGFSKIQLLLFRVFKQHQ